MGLPGPLYCVSWERAESLSGGTKGRGDDSESAWVSILGHSDGSVTAIYNRYGYVKEMRSVLDQWAIDLTADESKVRSIRQKTLDIPRVPQVSKLPLTNEAA